METVNVDNAEESPATVLQILQNNSLKNSSKYRPQLCAHMQRYKILKELHSAIPEEIFNKIGLFVNYARFRHGEAVYQHAAEAEHIYLIVEGEVALYYPKEPRQLEEESLWVAELEDSTKIVLESEVGSRTSMSAKVRQIELQKLVDARKERDECELLEIEHRNKPKYFRKEETVGKFYLGCMRGPDQSFGDHSCVASKQLRQDIAIVSSDDLHVIEIEVKKIVQVLGGTLYLKHLSPAFATLRKIFTMQKHVSDEQLFSFAQVLEECYFRDDMALYKEGDTAHEMFVLAEGAVAVRSEQKFVMQISGENFVGNEEAATIRTYSAQSVENSIARCFALFGYQHASYFALEDEFRVLAERRMEVFAERLTEIEKENRLPDEEDFEDSGASPGAKGKRSTRESAKGRVAKKKRTRSALQREIIERLHQSKNITPAELKKLTENNIARTEKKYGKEVGMGAIRENDVEKRPDSSAAETNITNLTLTAEVVKQIPQGKMLHGKLETIDSIRRSAIANSRSDASFAQSRDWSQYHDEGAGGEEGEENLDEDDQTNGGDTISGGRYSPQRWEYNMWGTERKEYFESGGKRGKWERAGFVPKRIELEQESRLSLEDLTKDAFETSNSIHQSNKKRHSTSLPHLEAPFEAASASNGTLLIEKSAYETALKSKFGELVRSPRQDDKFIQNLNLYYGKAGLRDTATAVLLTQQLRNSQFRNRQFELEMYDCAKREVEDRLAPRQLLAVDIRHGSASNNGETFTASQRAVADSDSFISNQISQLPSPHSSQNISFNPSTLTHFDKASFVVHNCKMENIRIEKIRKLENEQFEKLEELMASMNEYGSRPTNRRAL